MKVLDLQCALGHAFEGWFGSETDYLEQSRNSLVECPICGDPTVSKKLSAPRLALSKSRIEPQNELLSASTPTLPSNTATEAWFALARKLISETTDVGCNFAEEARKIHYGEADARGIRGTATLDETHALAEEGIAVLAIPLPVSTKERLQ